MLNNYSVSNSIFEIREKCVVNIIHVVVSGVESNLNLKCKGQQPTNKQFYSVDVLPLTVKQGETKVKVERVIQTVSAVLPFS